MKFLFLLLFPCLGFASVDVAFLEIKNFRGSAIELEPGEKFAHVAVSYKGQWLHAYIQNGVEIISRDRLEKIGTIKTIVNVPLDLNESVVESLLGKPYDFTYSWTDDEIYSSELVAKLLKIEPTPMTFQGKMWSEKQRQNRGNLGISPDEVFQAVLKKGGEIRNPKTLR